MQTSDPVADWLIVIAVFVIITVAVALDVVVAAVAAFILYFVKGEGIDTIRNLPREPKLYVLEKTWTMIKQAPNWLQWMAI